ncbi:YibE/F family protein [Gracilibacillus massiliensis]|uniref:YibE/F family protein n=1 Tax=Gracilibacillus massiliensis TaxID=1564956 RepID=UPI00071E3310|nr:YibE/F family protein [Gracilibacillus massiliensis]
MKKWKEKITKKHIIYSLLLLICFTASLVFVQNNHSFYDRPIAKVVETTELERTETIDQHDNSDTEVTQEIKAEILNGEYKGTLLTINNRYTKSQAIDHHFEAGDEFFVSVDSENQTGEILEVKRDIYVIFVLWIFLLILIAVGKKQGVLSFVSLAVNALILSLALDIYIHNSDISLLWISGISVVLFTILSLLLVNGRNQKTYAAIIATIVGTLSSLVIAYFVLNITGEQGLRYEEMSISTRNPQLIFMAGLLIGALGAVMDVAITMSSSLFELYEKNKQISVKKLRQSGLEIGKDIMGTMTNIIFFAYVSGSIPMMLLYLKNDTPLGFTLTVNLSIELARALAGGIGIVLTIPIAIYITLLFIKRDAKNYK